jgi:hypothetical protein
MGTPPCPVGFFAFELRTNSCEPFPRGGLPHPSPRCSPKATAINWPSIPQPHVEGEGGLVQDRCRRFTSTTNGLQAEKVWQKGERMRGLSDQWEGGG